MSGLDPAARRAGRASWILPPLALIGLGTMWGSTMPLARFAVTEGFPAIAYAFWGVLGAGVALSVVAVARGTRLPSWRLVRYVLVVGAVQFAIPNAIIYSALRHIPAGMAALCIATTSMMAYMLSLAVGWERFKTIRLIGIALGLAGIAVIFVPQFVAVDALPARWLAIGLLTPVCYASANLMLEHFRPPGVPTLTVAAGLLMGAAVCLLPLMVLTDSVAVVWPPLAPAELAAIATMAVNAVAFVGLAELIHRTGAVFASQMVYIATAFGVAYGMVLLNERHHWSLWLAIVLIFAGITLVRRRK